jgi:PPOX class probable F420-dependent enzyme
VIFTTWHSTVKALDLRHDPRISLCVDDDRPPFSFVLIEGSARFSDNPDEVHAWATRIAGRYMGAMRAKTYGARNSGPGELLVRVTPTHVVAQSGIAD